MFFVGVVEPRQEMQGRFFARSVRKAPKRLIQLVEETTDASPICSGVDVELAGSTRKQVLPTMPHNEPPIEGCPTEERKMVSNCAPRIEEENLTNAAAASPIRLRTWPGAEDSVEDLIGQRLLEHTPSLLPLLPSLALAAAHEVPVLFTGETGTGKTHLARLVHDASARRNQPFVTVPCGAQPASLIASTFFGHVRGAFTGADRSSLGKFAAAGEGTLLLDEVDMLEMGPQASLLRVLETGEYEPVGSNQTQRCRARIIAASNRDLEAAVGQGAFREDLYYRIHVLAFTLPPLRQRPQDIGPLVRGMVARFCTRFAKMPSVLGLQALAVLQRFTWPGNIRQLENVVQMAVLKCNGPEILPEHWPDFVRAPVQQVTLIDAPLLVSPSKEAQERLLIERTLAECGYNRSRTARTLGMSRVTLHKKLKKYGFFRA
jgi:DNA-binding NtrC family response regulator